MSDPGRDDKEISMGASGNGDRHDPRLEAAIDAIRQTPVAPAAVERVAARARRLPAGAGQASGAIRPASLPRGRDRFGRLRAILLMATLAAMVVVAAFVPGIVSQRRAAAAFAEVVERARAASSVRFASTQRIGQGRVVNARQLWSGRRLRYELIDGSIVLIFDLVRGKQLTLDTTNKLAELSPVDRGMAESVTDPVEQLARVAEQGVEPVPGQPDTFRGKGIAALGQAKIPDMVVVIDHESRLPTRIVISDPDPKHPFEVVLDNFEWDAPFDESLLSIDLPEGYTAHEGLVSTEGTSLEATAPLPPGIDNRIIHDRVPAAIFWNADGTRLTTLVRDAEAVPARSRLPNMLRQWDLATGALRWSEDVGGASKAAISSDKRFVATVVGFEVQLRDADSGAIERTWTTKEPLGTLAFSPDGATLAAGIREWGKFGGRGGEMAGGIEWWDVASGTLLRSIGLDLPTTFLAWSPDGRWIAASSNDGPVRLIDAGSGEVGRELPGRGPMAFSADGSWVACAAGANPDHPEIGRVALHRLESDPGAEATQTLETAAGRSPSTLLDLVFSPDDAAVVAADWNGDVTLWERESGRVVTTLRDHGDGFGGTGTVPGVISVSLSPDGQTLASGGEDGTVRLWSPGTAGAATSK